MVKGCEPHFIQRVVSCGHDVAYWCFIEALDPCWRVRESLTKEAAWKKLVQVVRLGTDGAWVTKHGWWLVGLNQNRSQIQNHRFFHVRHMWSLWSILISLYPSCQSSLLWLWSTLSFEKNASGRAARLMTPSSRASHPRPAPTSRSSALLSDRRGWPISQLESWTAKVNQEGCQKKLQGRVSAFNVYDHSTSASDDDPSWQLLVWLESTQPLVAMPSNAQ